MNIPGYQIIGPVAYMGKPDCEHSGCRRLWDEDGTTEPGCMDYHCSYCDEPCSMMGHRCDASQAILGAAAEIAKDAR